MAIVSLDKMTLYGPTSRRDAVIERLQSFGCAHLVELGRSTADTAIGERAADAREALKFLRACPQQLRQVQRPSRFDRAQVTASALELRREQHALQEERDELEVAIEQSEPWGEFRLPRDGTIRDVRLWFHIVPLRDLRRLEDVQYPYAVVSKNQRQACVVFFSAGAPEDVPGTPVELDPRPLSDLRDRLEASCLA